MSTERASFSRITFGLPVQLFKITAFISTQERLPAVTEFVLRLLHICGNVSLGSFKDYFGFTESEALAVIESLDRQGYVTLSDDQLSLSEETRLRFESSPDEWPWVTKLKRRTDMVLFDLLTFSILGRAEFGLATANWVRLNPPSESLGNSLDLARRSYRSGFSQIEREAARARGEERERSYGVHSIENVEARKPGYLPLTVSLEVDARNALTVRFPEEFEVGATLELLSQFRERVALTLEAQRAGSAEGLQEFLDLFELDFLRPYALGQDLDAYRLANEIQRGLAAPAGMKAIFGSVYLRENRDQVLTLIHEARAGYKEQPVRHFSSIAWLCPDFELWGRGEDFRQSVEAIRKAIRSAGRGDDLYVFDRSEERQENTVRAKYGGTGVVELHLVRPQTSRVGNWRASLEVMIYPGRFVVVSFHAQVSAAPGIRVPLGFISTQPKHLRIAHQLVMDAASGTRYAGRWSPTKETAARHNAGLSEACSFLAYSDVDLSRSRES